MKGHTTYVGKPRNHLSRIKFRRITSPPVLLLMFLFAIYLISTYLGILYVRRKETPPPFQHAPLVTHDIKNPSPLFYEPNVKCDGALPPPNDEEKFLTFLPHSGFHNQRISLENAIFLAWYTNRTLVIPPIIFGAKVAWGVRPWIEERLARLKPNSPGEDCRMQSTEVKCRRRSKAYTLLHWDQLFDMTFVKQNIRLVNRPDFNYDHLKRQLGITHEDQVYYQHESKRYEIGFYDNPGAKFPAELFPDRMTLCELRRNPKKLVHFRSLHGSKRILTELEGNVEFRQRNWEHLVFNHPLLIKVVNDIEDQLGGFGSYIGVHLRAGDNGYKKFKVETVRAMRDALRANGTISSIAYEDEGQAETVEHPDAVGTADRAEYWSAEAVSGESDDEPEQVSVSETESAIRERRDLIRRTAARNLPKKPTMASQCRERTGTRSPIVFIASDLDPTDPVLKPMFEDYPCLFTLSDFSKYTSRLKEIINPIDRTSIYKYVVPIADLILAARGGNFFGTHSSTFSLYCQRLHKLWIPNDDGQLVKIGHRY